MTYASETVVFIQAPLITFDLSLFLEEGDESFLTTCIQKQRICIAEKNLMKLPFQQQMTLIHQRYRLRFKHI